MKHGELGSWKTVTLGQHKDPESYREALESAGFGLRRYADQILTKTEVSKIPIPVDLVVLSVEELGLGSRGGARRDAIYARALELGLKLCPAEVGPALCLAHSDQPSENWFIIGMEPIAVSAGDQHVFQILHHRDPWLGSLDAWAGSLWLGLEPWVFCR